MRKPSSGGIVRVSKRESGYAIIDPFFLSDERLSWKAKGLLAYLLSKPSNWRVFTSDLVKRSKDGRDAVYSAIKELESCGYVERRQTRDESNRITGMETVVYERPVIDDPDPDSPQTEFPYTVEPKAENPTQVINDFNNNDFKKESNKSADNAILQALAKALHKLPLNDTSSLYDHYFEDIYAMLTRRFSGQLEPEVIALAADRYFTKAVDLRTGMPKPSVYSPVGIFHDAYTEALAEWAAIKYKRNAFDKR
ncbi:helix-turn-helix domain-containing protein [Paenibacillus sp. 7541]|uniref:helix-turn-helix domain-containing protein n=1 Tax=Paenibacillus sp. 7541 TaxID=2026236 RepID=UPI000BA7018E|nr:helix-turn-helix domain-containing protein [Paenibacillus sp. 7541]PAK55399.1 replication protein [Paenibacillus sp. 7541]